MTLEHPLFAPAEPLTIGAEPGNWLSLPDGDLLWWPGFLGAPQASALQQRLQAEIAWRHEQIRLFGRWHWQGSVHDLWNTLFWPSVILLLARAGVLARLGRRRS